MLLQWVWVPPSCFPRGYGGKSGPTEFRAYLIISARLCTLRLRPSTSNGRHSFAGTPSLMEFQTLWGIDIDISCAGQLKTLSAIRASTSAKSAFLFGTTQIASI